MSKINTLSLTSDPLLNTILLYWKKQKENNHKLNITYKLIQITKAWQIPRFSSQHHKSFKILSAISNSYNSPIASDKYLHNVNKPFFLSKIGKTGLSPFIYTFISLQLHCKDTIKSTAQFLILVSSSSTKFNADLINLWNEYRKYKYLH